MRFHVIIIGGGIGGLCLAQRLRKAGVSVAVYEKGPKRADPYWLHGTSHVPIVRSTLREVLLEGLDDAVDFGKEFMPDGKVTAFFADGMTTAGDVLVGADGALLQENQGATAASRRLPESLDHLRPSRAHLQTIAL